MAAPPRGPRIEENSLEHKPCTRRCEGLAAEVPCSGIPKATGISKLCAEAEALQMISPAEEKLSFVGEGEGVAAQRRGFTPRAAGDTLRRYGKKTSAQIIACRVGLLQAPTPSDVNDFQKPFGARIETQDSVPSLCGPRLITGRKTRRVLISWHLIGNLGSLSFL